MSLRYLNRLIDWLPTVVTSFLITRLYHLNLDCLTDVTMSKLNSNIDSNSLPNPQLQPQTSTLSLVSAVVSTQYPRLILSACSLARRVQLDATDYKQNNRNGWVPLVIIEHSTVWSPVSVLLGSSVCQELSFLRVLHYTSSSTGHRVPSAFSHGRNSNRIVSRTKLINCWASVRASLFLLELISLWFHTIAGQL